MELYYCCPSKIMVTITAVIIVAMSVSLVSSQGTRVGFYSKTCPRAETIVLSTVRAHFQSDPRVAPSLLRMHFHDCFVHGCDGSILINGSGTEKTAVPNVPLRGYNVIDAAKQQIEAVCPGIVSCADILALAARDSVVMTNGPSWDVPTGRRDGRVSLKADTRNLPSPLDSVGVQKQKFADKGLNIQDLVTLVGGHTIGMAGCITFKKRLYNFSSTGRPDPSIRESFLPLLQPLCPQNGNDSNRVALDHGSEKFFDTSYFANLRDHHGLLQSDQLLWTDNVTNTIIQRFLGVEGLPGLTFAVEFGKSMIKMSNIEVKTGSEGEIRKICSALN